MERPELEGVRGNKLCRNTAPIATTNNGDFIHDVNILDFKHNYLGAGTIREAEGKKEHIELNQFRCTKLSGVCNMPYTFHETLCLCS